MRHNIWTNRAAAAAAAAAAGTTHVTDEKRGFVGHQVSRRRRMHFCLGIIIIIHNVFVVVRGNKDQAEEEAIFCLLTHSLGWPADVLEIYYRASAGGKHGSVALLAAIAVASTAAHGIEWSRDVFSHLETSETGNAADMTMQV